MKVSCLKFSHTLGPSSSYVHPEKNINLKSTFLKSGSHCFIPVKVEIITETWYCKFCNTSLLYKNSLYSHAYCFLGFTCNWKKEIYFLKISDLVILSCLGFTKCFYILYNSIQVTEGQNLSHLNTSLNMSQISDLIEARLLTVLT